jgi:ribose 5-phosphate isomerase B
MKIALAADHAGYELKDELIYTVRLLGHEPLDLGGNGSDPGDDYPDFAEQVAEALRAGQVERGILVCGSGVGVSVAANKIPGIRAGLCHDTYSARQGVEHDDINVLVLGGRVVGIDLARELVRAFLTAEFSREERHLRRREKVQAIEDRYLRADE